MKRTLVEHLSELNVDVLKGWLRRVDALDKGLSRKGDMMRAIGRQLAANLPAVLKLLSPAERSLLQECAHCGRFVPPREFEAKHGAPCPLPRMRINYKEEVSLLVPFIHIAPGLDWEESRLVAEVEEPLRALLPPPPGVQAGPVSRVPTAWPAETQSPCNDPIRPIHIHESMRLAPVELGRVLGLIQAGKIKVTEAAKRPTEAATRLIAQSLVVPDHDLEMPEAHRNEWNSRHYTACGPVRAHAWPVLAQQCGWAKSKSGVLALTREGQDILNEFTPDKLRAGVTRFLADDNFDELNRIEHIRGQNGKGKRYISDPCLRKGVLEAAMAAWPIGQWLAYPEAFRLADAQGENWDVLGTSSPALYFFEPQYGWIADNRGLCSQYLRAFLMESLSTLGIVDVAYIYPHRLWPDLKDSLNGDLPFCGRYDGLLYVRLNPLGAYALELTSQCDFQPPETPKLFQVLSRFELALTNPPLDAASHASLELMAERKSGAVWALDVECILAHVENGGSLQTLRSFLENNATGPLPEDVRLFWDELELRTGAFRSQCEAVLLEWADEALARHLATASLTARLCFHCGGNRLVVARANWEQFSRAVKKLGFVVPPAK